MIILIMMINTKNTDDNTTSMVNNGDKHIMNCSNMIYTDIILLY